MNTWGSMTTITLRIDDELFEKLDKLRGTKQKSDFYRDILEDYVKLGGLYNIDSILLERDRLKSDLDHSQDIIRVQTERIQDLQKDIGFLQLEYQKINDRLMLPAPKSWWQFWKK